MILFDSKYAQIAKKSMTSMIGLHKKNPACFYLKLAATLFSDLFPDSQNLIPFMYKVHFLPEWTQISHQRFANCLIVFP